MRRLILIAAVSALVLAKPKPETYKETEDFQYSRSSSDDGTKAGYYGAQRGNMGGNYERAHNMDNLAQHQMSGLVRQVDGELGQGSRTRTGSVYTAANSRGIYGSGNYDLTNLQGRNFAEGQTVGNSQSHSSSSLSDSRYGGQSYNRQESRAGISSSHSQDARYSGYQTSRQADQTQIDNLQALDTSQGLGRYENNNQAGYNMKYHTQFGTHGRSDFDQSSSNLHSSSGYDANSQAHYITTPVKVVMRPGGRVAIPIAAPTYTVSQNILSENNGLTSDAEVFNQHVGNQQPTPTNKVKHYEASYSYRKQWEKHHAIPGDASGAVPTENPFPKNSELFEDAQLLQSSKNQFQNVDLQALRSNMNSDHTAYTKSGLNRSRFQAGSQQSQSGSETRQSQADFTSQLSQSGSRQSHSSLSSQQGSASSGALANAYGRSAQTSDMSELTNGAGAINSKPKSYQSSYSYHKSWERQGDPYVIKPVGPIYDGQTSERLMSGSLNNAAYSSHQYGTHSRNAHQSYAADCDDQGHIRVARSYIPDQAPEQSQIQWENLGQETQSQLENLEDLGQQQQNKWDNLQDFGQQTQDHLDNLQQLGQETQNQWGNLEQVEQQSQNQWDNLQVLGQQTQDKWDNLEDFGQQTNRNVEQHQDEKLEDLNQLSQKADELTKFEHQSNDQNENLNILSQPIQEQNPLTNFEQQATSQNENPEDLKQHSQNEEVITNYQQQFSNQNENFDIFSQASQKETSLTNFEQQANSPNENSPNSNIREQTTEVELQSYIPAHTMLFNQNQETSWYQNNLNGDKNVDSYDFMKPISQWTDNSDKHLQQVDDSVTGVNNENQLFPSPSEYNNLGQQNKAQELFTETNEKYDSYFSHMNNFNKYYDQSSNNFFPPSSTIDKANPLQSFWENIDNIAGEYTPPGVNNNDKNLFPDDNLNAQNQNNYSPNYMTVNSNVDSVNYNSDKDGNNNLFNEQIQNSNDFSLSHHSPKPVENSSTSINIQTSKPLKANQNTQDEGRGDIGSEETPSEIMTPDKSHTSGEEIETLSHTKEARTPKEGDAVFQSISNNNKYKPTENELLNTDISKQQNTNEKGKNEFNNDESRVTTTLPVEVSTTTVKSSLNVSNEKPWHKVDLDVLQVNNNNFPEFHEQILHQTTDDNIEIPVNEEQQNLEQQFEDSYQHESMQGQSSLHDFEKNLQNYLTPKQDVPSENPWHKVELDGSEVKNNNFSDLQKQIHHQTTDQNVEIPVDEQQQNLEQQFEDFYRHESVQSQTATHDFGHYLQSTLTLQKDVENKKEEQESLTQYQNEEIKNVEDNYEKKIQPSLHMELKDTNLNTKQTVEPMQVSSIIGDNSSDKHISNNNKVDSSEPEAVQPPLEASTEKPGFWKSVGNKLSNAKNKVFSWFTGS